MNLQRIWGKLIGSSMQSFLQFQTIMLIKLNIIIILNTKNIFQAGWYSTDIKELPFWKIYT